MLEDFLLQVQKPARYIGHEWNISRKDFDKSNIKFALCFPDLYEVGMSNLGMRIIYGILNTVEDVSCERFFACGTDMEAILRQRRLEILSLESKRGLKEFDMIGFSLGFELSYTNVLNILDLGGIPLKSSLRGHEWPLVIGGGPCVLNPEPMHEFFDLFILGEAEEVILEIVDIYRKNKDRFKSAKITKQDLLLKFSQVEGAYVPSLYEVQYYREGKIKEFRPKIEGVPARIKKRIVSDLDNSFFPINWLVPYIEAVHDRPTLEIMRGCPNKCRFCQARSQYFPLRYRGLKNILNLACSTYRLTGYEEISLGGLSVSDYAGIEELLKSLIGLFKGKMVGLSLPSIRPKTIVGDLSSLIATVRKTGLTFAPEAATEKLRNIIAKDFDMQDFLKATQQAYLCGYQRIKLYFMIGLPSEAVRDLDAIVDFALQVSELRRKIGPVTYVTASNSKTRKSVLNLGPAQVNISINTLIPKPHTPFQWLRMQDLDNIKYKQDYLKSKIKNKRLKLNFHNRYMSLLEGVFSRGDRRLSEVILSAFKEGARFDAWDNNFRFDLWQAVFEKTKIDPNFYVQEKSQDEILPWDFLDTGMDREYLLEEFADALRPTA
jgi:radical SAM family uncharacterized protein